MKAHTYNQFSIDLLRHIAMLKVSPQAKHLMTYLCATSEVNYAGIARISLYTMQYFTGMEIEDIIPAEKELRKAGEIIKGSEPDWLFVVNKFQHEPNMGEKVAIGVWNSLAQYPIDMVSAFKKRYGDTYSIPIAYPNELEHTDTDTETEKETDILPSKSDGDAPEKKRKAAPSNSRTRQITDCYQELYLKKFNKKPTWGSKEGKRIKELLERFEDDTDRICTAMRTAFDSDDRFLQDTVGSFMTLTAAAVITKADTMEAEEWTTI